MNWKVVKLENEIKEIEKMLVSLRKGDTSSKATKDLINQWVLKLRDKKIELLGV